MTGSERSELHLPRGRFSNPGLTVDACGCLCSDDFKGCCMPRPLRHSSNIVDGRRTHDNNIYMIYNIIIYNI